VDGLDELVEDEVQERREQVFFRVVVIVHRGGRLAVLLGDPFDREVGVAVLAKCTVGRPHDSFVGVRGRSVRRIGHWSYVRPSTG